ncbi:unnamed protein product [Cercospora beticola]|nr:unnamed protein product [Cercospora beticola]
MRPHAQDHQNSQRTGIVQHIGGAVLLSRAATQGSQLCVSQENSQQNLSQSLTFELENANCAAACKADPPPAVPSIFVFTTEWKVCVACIDQLTQGHASLVRCPAAS